MSIPTFYYITVVIQLTYHMKIFFRLVILLLRCAAVVKAQNKFPPVSQIKAN